MLQKSGPKEILKNHEVQHWHNKFIDISCSQNVAENFQLRHFEIFDQAPQKVLVLVNKLPEQNEQLSGETSQDHQSQFD